MTGYLDYDLLKCRCDILILIKYMAKRAKMWRVDCPFPNFKELGRDVALYNVAHDELVKVLRLLTYIYRVNGGKTWKSSS
jgi:hypothetical protein